MAVKGHIALDGKVSISATSELTENAQEGWIEHDCSNYTLYNCFYLPLELKLNSMGHNCIYSLITLLVFLAFNSCKTTPLKFIAEEGDTCEITKMQVASQKAKIYAGKKLIFEDFLHKKLNDTIWSCRREIYNFNYKEGYEYLLLVKNGKSLILMQVLPVILSMK